MTSEAGPTSSKREESARDDSTSGESTDSTSMTLAFAVGVLDDFDDPAAVFADARRWSSFVGIISDKMAYQVVNYIREQGIYNEDFFSRADKSRGLRHVKRSTDTDRHVLVGDSPEDSALAGEHGWEYLPLKEAAAAAGWDLVSDTVESSPDGGGS